MLDSHRKVILQIEARMDQLAENTTRKAAPLIEEPVAQGWANALAPKCALRSSTGTASTTAAKSAALLAAVRANTPAQALENSAPLVAWATSACAACLWRQSGVFTSGVRAGADFRSSIMFWDLESKPERLPKRKPLWPARACSPSISGESKPANQTSRCRPDPGGCKREPSEGETQRPGTGLRQPNTTFVMRKPLSVGHQVGQCPRSVSQYRTARLIEWPVSALNLPVASTLCAPVSTGCADRRRNCEGFGSNGRLRRAKERWEENYDLACLPHHFLR